MERAFATEEKTVKASELSKTDTAIYVHDMLNSLQKVAANKELSMLGHLIGLAKIEAKRCSIS